MKTKLVAKLRKRIAYEYHYKCWNYDSSTDVTIIAFNRKAADKEMHNFAGDYRFSFMHRSANTWGDLA